MHVEELLLAQLRAHGERFAGSIEEGPTPPGRTKAKKKRKARTRNPAGADGDVAKDGDAAENVDAAVGPDDRAKRKRKKRAERKAAREREAAAPGSRMPDEASGGEGSAERVARGPGKKRVPEVVLFNDPTKQRVPSRSAVGAQSKRNFLVSAAASDPPAQP